MHRHTITYASNYIQTNYEASGVDLIIQMYRYSRITYNRVHTTTLASDESFLFLSLSLWHCDYSFASLDFDAAVAITM